MTDLLGLPPLPPTDAHGTAIALIHAMRPLDAQRAALETRVGDVAYEQWALALGALVERLDAMLAPLAPMVLDARDRERWARGLGRRG